MREQFYIGREKELEKLEQFVLVSSASSSNPRISHVWGPDGIGKTAFIDKFSRLLLEETNPILWFKPRFNSTAVDSEEFLRTLIYSAQSNLGDLESWITQLITKEQPQNYENRQSPDFFWSHQLGEMLSSTKTSEFINLDHLILVFLIDDFSGFTNGIRISFCSFINHLKEHLKQRQRISVTLSSREELLETPDIYGYWESSLEDPLEIHLDNLNREDTFQLLDAHDLDSNASFKIYNSTKGTPGLLIAAIEEQNLQSNNSEDWSSRGKNLLLNFNNFQRKWLKWAAVVKGCNEESISLLADAQESRECMNWIRSKYPEMFFREKSDYILSTDNRRAVVAYLQKEESKLYLELSDIMQKFTIVKHAIPNQAHRELLSMLSELQFFDIPLIKKLYDESKANGILNLIENKPIFFREENQNYRLASNIRSSISIYNTLFNPGNREKLRNRIGILWRDKLLELNKSLENAEKNLHENEIKNRSLSVSITKIDSEINRLRHSRSNQRPIRQSITQHKKGSASKRFGAFLLQTTGIALLYINILVLEKFSPTYLGVSILCIIAGILYGMTEKKVEYAPVRVNFDLEEKENLDRVLQNLEKDRVSLLAQKEKTRLTIETDKSSILRIQTLLKQPYLPEPQSGQ